MDNRRLTKQEVETRLTATGIPFDYMLTTQTQAPYIVWNFDSASITASDCGSARVRQDTITIRLYEEEYNETDVDKVADAFCDFDIDISESYISGDQLYETSFTITHVGKF